MVQTPEDAEPSHFLEWERITQVPIQTSLVDWSLMAKYEMRWLNEHNKTVQEALEPLLQGDEDAGAREWLTKACKPHKIWPWDGVQVIMDTMRLVTLFEVMNICPMHTELST